MMSAIASRLTAMGHETSRAERVPMSFFEDGICRAYDKEPSRAMNIECLMLMDGNLDRSAFRGNCMTE